MSRKALLFGGLIAGRGISWLGCFGVLIAGILSVGTVQAATIAPGYSSRVDGVVTGTGPYDYSFTVFNTTPSSDDFIPVIVDWELPLFSTSDIVANSIFSPNGWTYEILSSWDYDTANDPVLASDPDIYGPNPQVFETAPVIIHWFATDGDGEGVPTYPIFPGESLDGFGFQSDYSSQNAPYLTSWDNLPPITGDPPSPGHSFGTPMSPARQQAQNGSVPEPTSLLLFAGLGVILLGGSSLRSVMRHRA